MKHKREDITGEIGAQYSSDDYEYPMYSYSRPAYNFWNGFYNGLRKRGLTKEQAISEMQSKGVRWMLDSDDSSLEKLGEKMAKTYQYYCDHASTAVKARD